MIQNKSVLAIIPAREGSKRCPEKNWTIYVNKSTGEMFTLTEWAIRHAKASKYIDTICIVSDSDMVLQFAKPPVIPLRLPTFIANGSSEAAIAFTLYSGSIGEPGPFINHDLFCLLQPTSPLRTAQDIDSCLELSASRNIPISSCNPSRIRNGAVYSSPTHTFLSRLSLSGDHFIMPHERSLDIDKPEDFTR